MCGPASGLSEPLQHHGFRRSADVEFCKLERDRLFDSDGWEKCDDGRDCAESLFAREDSLRLIDSSLSAHRTTFMLCRSPARIGLALVTAIVLSAGLVRVQLSAGSREIIPFGRAQQQANWFTVMGHVGRSQTYELPTSNPSLVDFIRFAGDLKPTATGQIRIVRNGRVAVRVRYSPTSTEKLLPGDLVIVDGKMPQGRIFRGRNSDAPASTGPVQIGLIGIRPWPVVMESAPERATIRWVTRQLGQHESVSASVKAIVPRNFTRTAPDTRLHSGSVLVFDPALIDTFRLPDGLPEPVNASRPAGLPTPATSARPPAPLALSLNPGLAARAGTSAPGHTAIPEPGATQFNLGPAVDRARDEFSKDLLTDPRSVALESQAAPAVGRTRVTDTSTAATRPQPDPSPDARIAPDEAASPGTGADQPAEIVESPQATRPFQSFIAQPAQIERHSPVPEISDTPDPGSVEAGNVLDAAAITAPAAVSLATQGATSVADSNPSETPDGHDPPQPPTPTTAGPDSAASADSSKLIPKVRTPWNWPAIAICIIGGIGILMATGMVLSIARHDTTPRPTPVAQTSRYWLDRIIDDELPIDEEPVQITAGEALFGRPTRIVRVDAPHASIPMPHFLKRGGQSGAVPTTPSAPNLPHPERTDDEDRDQRPTTYTPRRSDRPATRRPHRPDVPVRPAARAGQSSVVEPPAETALDAATRRTVRIDTAHPVTDTAQTSEPPGRKRRTPGTRPETSTAVSPDDARDKGLLDRILIQVDQGGRS